MSEGPDEDAGRALREAADAAAAHYANRRDEDLVGTPGWWDARRSRWGDVRLLDVVEQEYGRVARWAVVLVREAVLLGVLFWCVAFVMGFTVEGDRTTLLGVAMTPARAALVVAVLLRLLLAGIVLLVRRAPVGRSASGS